MKKDFKAINNELLSRQREWLEIVSKWVNDNKTKPAEKKRKYFQNSFGTEEFDFSEPFFTALCDDNNNYPFIMFVGQETNGWGDYQKFVKSGRCIEESQQYVMDFIKNNKDRIGEYDFHAFWNFIRAVYYATEKKINLVWTELDKIHYKCADSKCITLWAEDEKFLHKQVGNTGKSMLQLELDIISPDLVVFLTGPKYAQSMRDGLADRSINKPTQDVPVQEFDVGGIPCLWTYHPNYLNRANLWDGVIDSIADKIRSL